MNATAGAFPRGIDEVHVRDLDGAATDRYIVLGQVVGIHIDEKFIRDGLLDTASMRPIARAGYHDYFVSTPETRFSMRRPVSGGGDGSD